MLESGDIHGFKIGEVGKGMSWKTTEAICASAKLEDLEVGDRIYFPGDRRGFEIKIRNERFMIATKPHFKTVLYTIVDLELGACGPDNMIFCFGYETDKQIKERMQELINGEIEVSRRRGILINFDRYKKKNSRKIMQF